MSYLNSLFSLENKVAVVTGGTGVLGSSMVKALASAGAKVAIIGRRKNVADDLAQKIQGEGGTAIGVSADVLDANQLTEARKVILEKFGSINILVNGAGGNMPGATIPTDKTFLDLKLDDFRQVVDLNLTGSVLPTQILGEPIMAARSGCIINISSMAAYLPITRVVGYSAAKAAISNFTQWLAVEVAKKFGEGIRVNAIAPGFFLTEQNRTLLTTADGGLTDRGKAVIGQTPFGRFGKPEELDSTLVWLCSDGARFVSGVVVAVDGGFSSYAGV